MYKIIRPPEHLKRYIDTFWWGDDLDLPQRPNVYHSVATSKIELLFFDQGIYSLKQDGKEELVSRSSFYGQSTSFKHYIAVVPRSSIFGITFSPLAALSLLRIPAYELSQQTVDIDSILGNQGNELSEKIYQAQTFQQKAAIAADFFNSRMKELDFKYLNVEKLTLSIDQTNLNSIPDLVANSFLSQRQFERNFKDLTGFSAKTYLKIKRFERFIANASIVAKSSDSKLLDIALDLGYYDQAHLNRHFKEFTGLNPKAYFQNLILQESSR